MLFAQADDLCLNYLSDFLLSPPRPI